MAFKTDKQRKGFFARQGNARSDTSPFIITTNNKTIARTRSLKQAQLKATDFLKKNKGKTVKIEKIEESISIK